MMNILKSYDLNIAKIQHESCFRSGHSIILIESKRYQTLTVLLDKSCFPSPCFSGLAYNWVILEIGNFIGIIL